MTFLFMNVAFYIKNALHNKSWGQILNPGTLNMYKKNFVITCSHCRLQLENMENKQFFLTI